MEVEPPVSLLPRISRHVPQLRLSHPRSSAFICGPKLNPQTKPHSPGALATPQRPLHPPRSPSLLFFSASLRLRGELRLSHPRSSAFICGPKPNPQTKSSSPGALATPQRPLPPPRSPSLLFFSASLRLRGELRLSHPRSSAFICGPKLNPQTKSNSPGALATPQRPLPPPRSPSLLFFSASLRLRGE